MSNSCQILDSEPRPEIYVHLTLTSIKICQNLPIVHTVAGWPAAQRQVTSATEGHAPCSATSATEWGRFPLLVLRLQEPGSSSRTPLSVAAPCTHVLQESDPGDSSRFLLCGTQNAWVFTLHAYCTLIARLLHASLHASLHAYENTGKRMFPGMPTLKKKKYFNLKFSSF